MLRHFPHLQPLLLLQKEAVPQGEAEAEDSHKNCLLQSSLYYLNKEAEGSRQEAGGRVAFSINRSLIFRKDQLFPSFCVCTLLK